MEKDSFDLKAELKSIGMTQKDFAELSGFSTSTISTWNSKNKISKVGVNFLLILKELKEKNRELENLKNDYIKLLNIKS
ncbi:Helix-turn-helix protein [Thiovulum sp. ES]|nr:Helix-turn-helix protein [Thiovulum sp. ES]